MFNKQEKKPKKPRIKQGLFVDEIEKNGKVWIPQRLNIQFLLQKFFENPIPIRDIYILMQDRSTVWPRVSDQTGIAKWQIEEMIDAQYPHLPQIRSIQKRRYVNKQPVMRLRYVSDNKRQKLEEQSKKQDKIDETINKLIINSAIFKSHHLGSLHTLKANPDGPIGFKTELKNIVNEHDLTEILPEEQSPRLESSEKMFYRINPTIYAIVYGNVLRLADNIIEPDIKKHKPVFQLEPEDEKAAILLFENKQKEYAKHNAPKIAHWTETRQKVGINSAAFATLLRVDEAVIWHWENGYRAPTNIRVFYELFCQYPEKIIDMLIKVQNEIRDKIIEESKNAFKLLSFEWVDSHHAPPNQTPLPPSPNMGEFEPRGPQEAIRSSLAGEVACPAAPPPPPSTVVSKPRGEKGGRYSVVPVKITGPSGATYSQFRQKKSLIDFVKKFSKITDEEIEQFHIAGKVNWPQFVVKNEM